MNGLTTVSDISETKLFLFLAIIIQTGHDIQGPPVNQVIWQQRFSIFNVSGEGE